MVKQASLLPVAADERLAAKADGSLDGFLAGRTTDEDEAVCHLVADWFTAPWERVLLV